VRREVVGRERRAAAGKIGRRRHDERLPGLRHLHGNHVGGGEVADGDRGVETLGHNVDRRVAEHQLEFHLGVGG
jgi:hypothetical protein